MGKTEFMISIKDIINAYKKEHKSLEYIFEVLLKESENYDFYYEKYINYLQLQNKINDILSSRKNINNYIRSLSFEQTVKFVYYVSNNYPDVKFYRTNHHNDFVLEAFGVLDIKDKNLIEYNKAIEKIIKLEEFDPPEIDAIGKYNSLVYYALSYSNDYVLEILIDRENPYYHSGISLNYYLWQNQRYQNFIDTLRTQSVLTPQYSYFIDEQFDLITYICLDEILIFSPEKVLINLMDNKNISRFLRLSPTEVIEKDIGEMISSIEQIKTMILFGKLDVLNTYKSSLEILKKVGFNTSSLEYF